MSKFFLCFNFFKNLCDSHLDSVHIIKCAFMHQSHRHACRPLPYLPTFCTLLSSCWERQISSIFET
uniref:Uncharacterized protein n=1 Tax=Rhizophora mucronata TaxID=61149 RepID=A0A2P2P5M0_RHIMU